MAAENRKDTAGAVQPESPIIIFLNGEPDGKEIVQIHGFDPHYPRTRYVSRVGFGPIAFSFEPLVEAMKAEGIKDPAQHPSWPERRHGYVNIPAIADLIGIG